MLHLHKRCLFITLSLFFIAGCHNNAHIRTQKMLDKGEKVFSLNASLPMGGENGVFYHNALADTNSRDHTSPVYNSFAYSTMVSGLRTEFSFLKGHQKSESGVYGGLGMNSDGEQLGSFIGLEHRKYININSKAPLKAGINVETTLSNSGSHVLHSIQSIKTGTSENDKFPFYIGFHTLYTRGYRLIPDQIKYKFNTRGAGISFGYEEYNSLMKNGSIVLQVDVSLIKNEILNINPNSKNTYFYENYNSEYQPLVSIGFGVNQFIPIQSKKDIFTPLPAPTKINHHYKSHDQNSILGEDFKTFDPETGERIKETPDTFDPETGELNKIKTSKSESFIGENKTNVKEDVFRIVKTRTTLDIEKLAFSKAGQDHNHLVWSCCGVFSCGTGFTLAVTGGAITNSFPGFLLGGLIGYTLPSLILNNNLESRFLSKNLNIADTDSLTLEQKILLEREYSSKTKKLRYSSALNGSLVAIAISLGSIFSLIILAG